MQKIWQKSKRILLDRVDGMSRWGDGEKMKFSKLELALLNNCVQMRSVEKLYQEVQQQQCKICVNAELPVPEMKNFVYEHLLAEHTKRIMAVTVFRDGRKYLYGEEVNRERYMKLFNAHLEAIGYEYFDACGLKIGTKGKILESGEYACTVSYKAG